MGPLSLPCVNTRGLGSESSKGRNETEDLSRNLIKEILKRPLPLEARVFGGVVNILENIFVSYVLSFYDECAGIVGSIFDIWNFLFSKAD